MPVFYASGWFITLFSNALQYTHQSYLVSWIMDFTIAHGMKGFYRCLIVLLKYLRYKFVKMGFEQIMNFMSDLTKKELFVNVAYSQYQLELSSGKTDEQLRSKYIKDWEDFKFLNCFRERVESLQLNGLLIQHLENKYTSITQKVNSKL
jgi:hypothetical protein